MKDRQAQLEQNIVAENLAGFYKKIEPYSKLILTAVVIVIVALIAVGLYSSGEVAKRSDATLQLLMENPEVASQYPDTVAAAWSLLFQGNENLAQGINSLYQDRDEAETLLSQAKDHFSDARAASKETLLLSRANFGLGMAAESLGEIDEAIDAYKRTVEANESEAMVAVAQERIDRLSSPDTVEFLAWFSDQDFSPADPSLPPELPGASSLPDLPDLDLPDLNMGDDLKSSDEPSAPIQGGLELPETTEPEMTEPETTEPETTEPETAEPETTSSETADEKPDDTADESAE
ncbi:MAG: tetratricopeptide repeat protein [Phycisphaera sp. RhM]|nr:tetratricopeptide repeat protein [Phycisphaera sp. RhM]